MDTIEDLTLSNTPDVFGLHPNAEIGYYTHSAKDMWNHLVELQPQTGGESGGISREEFIGKIATDIQGKLPPLFDVDRVRKNITDITPTYVVLLQELDRFNVLIRKMSTSLINLQRVRNCNLFPMDTQKLAHIRKRYSRYLTSSNLTVSWCKAIQNHRHCRLLSNFRCYCLLLDV